MTRNLRAAGLLAAIAAAVWYLLPDVQEWRACARLAEQCAPHETAVRRDEFREGCGRDLSEARARDGRSAGLRRTACVLDTFACESARRCVDGRMIRFSIGGVGR